MFYAIEYAYGAHVINNGNRGDRVLEFTSRRLRDAWVSAGNVYATNPGYRESLSARHPAVRKAYGLESGDGEGWRVIGEARVNGSAALRKHAWVINQDWTEIDHWRWVATAPEKNIVDWAETTEKNLADLEA